MKHVVAVGVDVGGLAVLEELVHLGQIQICVGAECMAYGTERLVGLVGIILGYGIDGQVARLHIFVVEVPYTLERTVVRAEICVVGGILL